MVEETEDEERRFRIALDPRLVKRIEWLIEQPELGFSTFEHFVAAALYSFTSYREDVLRKMRGERRY
ncbi:MAG: hypothetical protein V3U30_04125 [Thermoplasmata archaeon]